MFDSSLSRNSAESVVAELEPRPSYGKALYGRPSVAAPASTPCSAFPTEFLALATARVPGWFDTHHSSLISLITLYSLLITSPHNPRYIPGDRNRLLRYIANV
jgi:hypothetical protein